MWKNNHSNYIININQPNKINEMFIDKFNISNKSSNKQNQERKPLIRNKNKENNKNKNKKIKESSYTPDNSITQQYSLEEFKKLVAT